VKPDSWRHNVTPYQWLVLFVAWLGWVFDSMNSTIYALVLQPALHDLLRPPDGRGLERLKRRPICVSSAPDKT